MAEISGEVGLGMDSEKNNATNNGRVMNCKAMRHVFENIRSQYISQKQKTVHCT